MNTEELKKLRESIVNNRDPDKLCITVCAGTACRASGSEKVILAFEKEIKERNLSEKVDIMATGCHGFCEMGPIVVIRPKEIFYHQVTGDDVSEIISETIIKDNIIDRLLYTDPATGKKIIYNHDVPFYKKQQRIALRHNGIIDPANIEDYIAVDGYIALSKAVNEMMPEDVIEEVKKSGLRGRGGAGFPTGLKWGFCRGSEGEPKYIVCNADEGDPGAYMDRSVLEGNPHAVIEGMLIGAYAIGASEGYVYVRTEYPLAIDNLTVALQQAAEYGFLGENIFGTDFSFKIYISQGAGAFVCGEETALIHSIEGKKAEPRVRPPFPAQEGLWGKPTNINNVETWSNVPAILMRGGDWYSSIGSEKSKGTKVFSLVGKVNNTGLVEVPMGIPLREIVYDIGGGILKGKNFKAVQTGGPSGGCIPAELIDLPVDYEHLDEAGSIMGSGGMVVMDEDTCIVDIARFFLAFTEDESCGRCNSCREGINAMLEVLTRISKGEGREGDIEFLEELANAVKDASLCALGGTAPNPVLSTLRHFRDEYEHHIKYRKCPAVVCKDIISSPCKYTCPINQDAACYAGLIAQGRFREAIDVIRKENPLPVICGRVCHHPCEGKCESGKEGEPIAIRALKRFAADWELKNGIKVEKKTPKYAEKVAIVGSGPAGLTAAYFLTDFGYEVTIFESAPVSGGMLALGIPDYRLPGTILDHDIEAVVKGGVTIKTNTTVGRNMTIKEIFENGYGAVFIAIGAHKSMKLGIPGEEGEGVMDALDFLRAINLKKEVKIGKKVAVIGGGNAAVDAARSALRLGSHVHIIYRRTRAEMPANEEEIEAALAEGIDIKFLAAPVKVLSENGKIKGLECLRMELGEVDKSGRRRPVPVEGSEFTVEIDTLVPAIGQRPDVATLLGSEVNLETGKGDTLIVDPGTYATNIEGIFAGGDAVSGPATVTEAMSAGKIAASSIHKYLRGEAVEREYGVLRPAVHVEPVELTEEELEMIKRHEMPALSIEERSNNFREVELGFTEEQAVMEAKRCLRCDLQEED